MRRSKLNPLRKFEVLEDRRMMTGDIDYNNGIITIDGAGYDDVAEVRFEGNRVYVDLIAEESDGDTDDHDFDKKISDVSKIVFNGFAGNDKLTVFVNQLNSGVTLDNVLLEFSGGNDNDQLFNVLPGGVRTVALGGAGQDILQGSKYNDVFEGGAGNDELHGGAGNDTYVFSGSANLGTDSILNESANVGSDTLDLTNFGHAVLVNLEWANYNSVHAVTTEFGSAPTFNLKVKLYDNTAIENVIGTAYRDNIIGNSRPNYLSGLGDSDRITGAGGNDTLDGGAGHDVYVFSGSNLGTDEIIDRDGQDTLEFGGMSSGVSVDLTKVGTNYAVNSADLKLMIGKDTAIENVYGTRYDDKIIGNSLDNQLSGLGGNDMITGGDGADYLFGNEGDDKLYTDALDHVFGGLGRDWFDGHYETLYQRNPRPGRYMDWTFI